MSNSAADTSAEQTPYDGVDSVEWKSMVERGSAAGVLPADEIAHVLRKVELTAEVLQGVHSTLAGHGITIDDQVEELNDITSPTGIPVIDDEDGVVAEDTDGLLARRRRKRAMRPSHERTDSGGTADTVRMYQIGRAHV